MTYIVKPKNHHPLLEKNELGLTRRDYEGAVSTLCAGCGHDSISSAIVEACFQLSIESYKVAKLSGIGCSSKAPAYFLNQSHGFNSVHGRMPSIATGAAMANHELLYLGISGDGDSASIGSGQLVPLLKAALSHKGFSFLDIISPCVTFNNHNTSTKSYDYIREHNDALSRPDFVPSGKEIVTDYPRGTTVDVPLHDGSLLSLEKLSEDYDPTNKITAIKDIQESQRDGKVLTGLLYVDPEAKDLRDILNVSDKPLNEMSQNELCPGSEKLKDINLGLK